MIGFREQGLPRGAIGRAVLCVVAVTATVAIGLAIPGVAGASVIAPWGSSLTATPTLDTANGASSSTNDEPKGMYDGTGDNQAISTGFDEGCKAGPYGSVGTVDCTPWIHDGADNTEWNTAVAGGTATAPAGGQILQIKVKGCAVKEDRRHRPRSPSGHRRSTTSEFDTMSLQSDGSFKVHYGPAHGTDAESVPDAVLRRRRVDDEQPGPDDHAAGTVTPDSITTFIPLHLCVAPGEVPAFYDIGGFIPNDRAERRPYPQGVPFQIMAPVTGLEHGLVHRREHRAHVERRAGVRARRPAHPARRHQPEHRLGLGAEPGAAAPGDRGCRRRRLRPVPRRRRGRAHGLEHRPVRQPFHELE